MTSAGKVLLATVKGDVHDIGKNIVSVILSCNNYQVVDLGVMVPTETIIDTAIKEKADIVGLSGLITPSLEEMVNVAARMEERGLKIPLLIGGATTSEVHTAVKIAPAYSAPVVHVKDASKAVPVITGLLSGDNRMAEKVRSRYATIRSEHEASRSERVLLSIETARKNRILTANPSPKPLFTGVSKLSGISIAELTRVIDWTFFFFAWKINGRFPEIFKDPVKGPEAKKLYDDALLLIDRINRENLINAEAVYGIFRAERDGDDVIVYPEGDKKPVSFNFLRNQEIKEAGQHNLCLSDFVADRDDHVGAFVVTAKLAGELPRDIAEDDYNSIMLRILSDRFAEAAAEWIHREIRVKLWGYAPDEHLSADELFRNSYSGIRPAPGYPACPDHRGKKVIFDLLDATAATGVSLTESYAMYPPSSVCAYVFAAEESSYFNVGKIGGDQVADYARRTGTTEEEARRWLAPNL